MGLPNMLEKCKHYKDLDESEYCSFKGCHCSLLDYDIKHPNEFFAICKHQICERSSIYGNRCFVITDDDIEALKHGKILSYVDEYGIFITYDEECD